MEWVWTFVGWRLGRMLGVALLLTVCGLVLLAGPAAAATVVDPAVDDPPVNTVPGAQTTPGNTPRVFSAANGNAITIADVDADGADVQTTLAVTNGTLAVGAAGTRAVGAAGTAPPLTSVVGNGTATVVLTGSLTEITAVLDGLTYTPTSGFTGTATLTVTTNDQGNTGSGGPLQDQDSVTIDVGALPTVSVDDPAAVAEGDAGTPNSIVFTVTLSAQSTLQVTVPFSTANQTATGGAACAAGLDYVTTAGTVAFVPNDTSETISVPICGDALVEGNETVLVNLGQPTNATLADGQGQGTITDDDQTGTLSFSAPTTSVPENAGSVAITVQRSGVGPAGAAQPASASAGTSPGASVPSDSVVPGGRVRPNPPASPPAPGGGTVAPSALGTVTVSFATADGTAMAGQDYVATAGTLTLGVNDTTKTITIPILTDSLQEGPESFTVTLSSPTGGAGLGAFAVVTVTIIDTSHGAAGHPGDDSADAEREERERETEEERRQRARTSQGNKDDDAVEGDVIETRCEQPWPAVIIANRDGAVEVKLLKEARRACSSIAVGDYLDADGEKQHEALFYADSVEIKRRR